MSSELERKDKIRIIMMPDEVAEKVNEKFPKNKSRGFSYWASNLFRKELEREQYEN